MADSKKYDGSQWEHSLRKLTTATEAVENPLYSDGTAITSYTIKGNTVQSGTPTPSNPVAVNGVGERTSNLAETIQGGISASDGSDAAYKDSSSQIRTQYIPCEPNTDYVVSSTLYPVQNFVSFYDSSKVYISRTSGSPISQARAFTTPATAAYMRTTFTHSDDDQIYPYTDGAKIMINAGSTAAPFEPWGFKIPISSASTTTPVYLGSVASTRKIKKYVFTGQEADLRIPAAITATNAIQAPTTMSDYEREPFICSHMQVTNSSSGSSTHGYYGQYLTLCFALSMGLDTLDKARTYLQQQYANGTPVTVWYVLSEPTTGIVNEPLMKIGDYADTLSNATAIPTTEGANSITVDTTVQPSEFSATWTGWHDSSVKEYDGTDWQ